MAEDYGSMVKRYLGSRYPADAIDLHPDLVMYTWACVFGKPIPDAYVTQLLRQAAGVLRGKAQLLFYSRFGIDRDHEVAMIGPFADSPLFAVLCLEDMPDVFPFATYDELMGVWKDDLLYFMDYLRQLAMYEGSRVREAVRAYALANGKESLVDKLHGDAIMYADMDIEFYSSPDVFVTQHGACCYSKMTQTWNQHIQKATGVRPTWHNHRQVIRDLLRAPDAAVHIAEKRPAYGDNSYIVCGYQYAATFRERVPHPNLTYDMFDDHVYHAVNVLMQLPMLMHRNDWTHFRYRGECTELLSLDTPVVRLH